MRAAGNAVPALGRFDTPPIRGFNFPLMRGS
jgi:hypothetical protein